MTNARLMKHLIVKRIHLIASRVSHPPACVDAGRSGEGERVRGHCFGSSRAEILGRDKDRKEKVGSYRPFQRFHGSV